MLRKKIYILGIFILFLLFLLQIFVMNLINDKIVNQILNQDKFELKNVKYSKGLLNSHLEFDLFLGQGNFEFLSSSLQNSPLKMNLEFKHNIFSKSTIKGTLKNTLAEFEPFLKDNLIATIWIKILPFAKSDLSVMFPSIIFKDDMSSLKVDKMKLQLSLDESKIYALDFQVKEFTLSNFVNHVNLKGFSYQEEFKNGVKIADFDANLNFSQAKFFIQELQIQKNKLNDILLELSNSENSQSSAIFDLDLILKIQSLSLRNKEFQALQGDLQNVFLKLKLGKISKQMREEFLKQTQLDLKTVLREFLSFNPFVKLENLSFSKNEKKLVAMGEANLGLNGYKINANVQSDVGVGEFLPILNLIEGFFVEKEGKYYLDLKADTTVLGQEIMELNGKSYALEGWVID